MTLGKKQNFVLSGDIDFLFENGLDNNHKLKEQIFSSNFETTFHLTWIKNKVRFLQFHRK